MAESSEVLFEIKREHLDTGLRGFPVGTCRTSKVDPIEGVALAGYPIADVWDLEPEQILYLLFHRELPTNEQLAAFEDDIKRRAGIPQSVFAALRALPKEGHPMEWLISGLATLGMVTKTGNWKEDALNLVARTPELVAAIFRLHSGWGEPIASDNSLGLIENFVHMLGVPGGDTEKLTKMLKAFYNLHIDHGGGNLSTFVGKSIASGHADVYASMAGAMAALYGPLHGRANQDCLEFIKRVGTADEGEVKTYLENALANKEKIYGFGHAVLRAEDPRATIQYALGEEICPDDLYFSIARTLRKVGPPVLLATGKVSNPYPNVDAVSGSLLNACGLGDSNFFTVLFGFSRISGIAAQIVEERTVHREGKGVPITRPKYIAVDQPRRLRPR